MSDACEFLERRAAADGTEFDHERAYCTAVGEFVQPMRADVCAKRYGLDPESDCEFYREAAGLGSITGFDGESTADDAGAGEDQSKGEHS